MTRVYDMQQDVRLHHLFQGGPESGDQLMGQFTDEPYRIGKQDLLLIGKVKLLVVGSRVAKSLSSTKTLAPVRLLSKVDLPALV